MYLVCEYSSLLSVLLYYGILWKEEALWNNKNITEKVIVIIVKLQIIDKPSSLLKGRSLSFSIEDQ